MRARGLDEKLPAPSTRILQARFRPVNAIGLHLARKDRISRDQKGDTAGATDIPEACCHLASISDAEMSINQP